MDMGKEAIKTEGCKFVLHDSSLLASVDVKELQTEGLSRLHLNRIMYNIHTERGSRVEKEKVTL